jgi:hypothetical protein
MKLKSLIRKSLAKVPPEFAGQQRRFAESVSENLDVLSGRRGNLIDRAVTFRDLLDAGVLRRASGLVTDTGTIDLVPAGDPNDPDNGIVDAPTQPTGLSATGGFGRIYLSWNLPRYRGHSRIQVFRHTSDNLSAAQAAGVYYEYFGDAHFFYDIGLPSNTTYYYWVRSVNRLGAISAFNSSTGTSATTAIDYLYVSDLIDDILDDDVNSLGLNTAISNAGVDVTQIQQDISNIQDDIDDLNSINAWSSSASYVTDDMVTHSGKIWKASQASTNQTPAAGSSYWTEIGNYSNLVDFVSATQDQNVSTLSSLNTNYYTISGTNGAISAATTNLASQSYVQTELADYTNTANLNLNYYTKTGANNAISAATTNLASTTYVQNELGDYTTTANLNLNYYTKTAADSAISSSIGTYTTTVGSETLTLQQHHSSINGIEGKYSIKIDDNGSVAGFGLISTANDGVPSTGTGSAFIVAADRFAITSDADSLATENGTVGDNYPFKVFTAPHNVTDADGNQSYNADGTSKTIPAGVYIDNAFIHDAQITGAMIEEATITDANIGSLDAGKIRSGQIQIDNQNNFAIFQGKTQVVGQDADGNDIIEGDYGSNSNGFFLGNVNGYAAFNMGNATNYIKFNGNTGVFEATGAVIKDLSVTTVKIGNDAITVPDSEDFAAPSTEIKIGANSSAWTECVRMTVDWGSGWQDINSVLVFGRQRFGGILGSRHLDGMQESIFMRLNRINSAGNATSPRGQVWTSIDRPGRDVQYHTFAEFPAPIAQNESYIIEAYATYSGTASQGYWTRQQAGMVVQASKK